jgi:predicted metalloprotease
MGALAIGAMRPPDRHVMSSRFLQHCGAVVLALAIALVGAVGPRPATMAAHANSQARAAATAIEVAGNLDEGNVIPLYDRLHPDLRERFTLQAFATWLESGTLASIGPEPSANEVVDEAFTLDATGATYPDAVRVTLVGDGPMEVVLSEVVGRWRWLPELSVDDLEALVTATGQDQPVDSQAPAEYLDIERYWTGAFAIAGHPYAPLRDVVAVADPTLDTTCGSDLDIKLIAIYYCDFDQTIYYDPAFATRMRTEFGNFAWVMIIAHEWGHHVQAMLGLNLPAGDPELGPRLYVIESELLSDCLAGLFVQDLLARGEIGEVEMAEAEHVVRQAADKPGTTFDNFTAHGSGDQRVAALFAGIEDGFAGCHVSLAPPAP